MSDSRQMVFLYPDGITPDPQSGWGLTAAALREQGMEVEELVIGDGFEMILDRLENGAIPVVVKPDA